MANQESGKPSARGGMTVLCFLAIILGQAYLLRNMFSGSDSAVFSLPFLIEGVFCFFMLAGCIICWIKPMGWSTKPGCIAVLALFALYAVFNIIFYHTFASAYLTGLETEYSSTGGGMIGLKLVLALCGCVAGMPVAAPIDGHEYSRRLREKVEQQNAQWAQASLEGAKKDFEKAAARLKQMEEQQAENSEITEPAACPASSSPSQPESSVQEKKPASEEWRGWGCG